MKVTRLALSLMFLICLASAAFPQTQEVPAEYREVFTILGKQGDFASNVLKVNIPRNDLMVSIQGMPVPTALGFGGWVAMTKGEGGKNVMMGDLVLIEKEVNPVMSALLNNGIEVTALHNHFFFRRAPHLLHACDGFGYTHRSGSQDKAGARSYGPAIDSCFQSFDCQAFHRHGTACSDHRSQWRSERSRL